MKAHGFTLIELMVAVAILGILSAIAVPKLFAFKAKAVMSEVTVQFASFERLAEVHTATQASTPQSIQELGLDIPSSRFFKYNSFVEAKASGNGSNAGSNKKNTGKNQGQGQQKQVVCHNGHSITIANPAVYNAHLAHGDQAGECPNSEAALVFEAQSLQSIASNCAAGSTLQVKANAQGTARVEVSGNCSEYMVGHDH
jgi:prepilin-type N-terminal cleavage/methylation domain-containing protein